MLELRKILSGAAAVLFIALWASPTGVHAQRSGAGEGRAAGSKAGQQLFASSCSGCHGLDGRGGERAPNIASSKRIQQLSDRKIFQIIQNGISGTGMPAFHSLAQAEIREVVQYLRVLQGNDAKMAVTGDAGRGKFLFSQSCANCHMLQGQGGFLASDLTGYGLTHSVKEIRSAITNPGKSPDPRRSKTVVTTKGGEKLVGITRNEDNFSLQLQTEDGAFHFLTKSELASIERQPEPLMPSDYGSKLDKRDLDDLISYLVSAGRSSGSKASAGEEE